MSLLLAVSRSERRLARGKADGSGGGVGLPLFGAGGTARTVDASGAAAGDVVVVDEVGRVVGGSELICD